MENRYKIDIDLIVIILGFIQIIPTIRSLNYFNVIWSILYITWLFLMINKSLKINRISNLFLMFLLYLIFITVIPILGSNLSISLRYFELSQIFAFSVAFTTVKSKYYNKILQLSLIIATITSLITLFEYQTNPFVSRLVMKNSEEMTDVLQFRGIGGYNFIYSLLFFTIYLLYNKVNWFSNLSKRFNNIIYYSTLLLFIITIFKSNFATGLILLLISIMNRFLLGKEVSIKKIVIVIFISLFIFTTASTIIGVIIAFYENVFGLDTNYNRLLELQSFYNSGIVGTSMESRISSFTNSISLFLDNLIFGIVHTALGVNSDGQINSFGQHSYIIDTFALYGIIIGFLQVILIFKSFQLNIKLKSKIIMSSLNILFVFLILSTVNNMTPSIGFIVFFILPILEKNKVINIQKLIK